MSATILFSTTRRVLTQLRHDKRTIALVVLVPVVLLTLVYYLFEKQPGVFNEIGLIMLVGLAAKNAILIVEFAKAKHDEGQSVEDAALESARLRFRPILMTAFAFILGVVPLILASGNPSSTTS